MDANKQEAKTAYPTKAYTRQEIEQFRLYRPELEEKLRSGSLCYAVEWWENDSIDIDENAHIFFCFQNEDYVWEFVLNRQIHDEVKEMLATIGVDWEYHFKAQFGSNILYPPFLCRPAILRESSPRAKEMVGTPVPSPPGPR